MPLLRKNAKKAVDRDFAELTKTYKPVDNKDGTYSLVNKETGALYQGKAPFGGRDAESGALEDLGSLRQQRMMSRKMSALIEKEAAKKENGAGSSGEDKSGEDKSNNGSIPDVLKSSGAAPVLVDRELTPKMIESSDDPEIIAIANQKLSVPTTPENSFIFRPGYNKTDPALQSTLEGTIPPVKEIAHATKKTTEEVIPYVIRGSKNTTSPFIYVDADYYKENTPFIKRVMDRQFTGEYVTNALSLQRGVNTGQTGTQTLGGKQPGSKTINGKKVVMVSNPNFKKPTGSATNVVNNVITDALQFVQPAGVLKTTIPLASIAGGKSSAATKIAKNAKDAQETIENATWGTRWLKTKKANSLTKKAEEATKTAERWGDKAAVAFDELAAGKIASRAKPTAQAASKATESTFNFVPDGTKALGPARVVPTGKTNPISAVRTFAMNPSGSKALSSGLTRLAIPQTSSVPLVARAMPEVAGQIPSGKIVQMTLPFRNTLGQFIKLPQ